MGRNPSKEETRIPVMQRLMVNMVDTASLLDLSYQQVTKLVKANELPHIRIGNEIRIPLKQLEEWIERRTEP
jgi:excisionase family DNA binding protein